MDNIDIVTGIGFGDEGKGTIADFLTRLRDASLIVRYNGAAQAGHNVVLPKNDIWHCFAQFGAGMFLPSARTLLSRFMYIKPDNLIHEGDMLVKKGVGNAYQRLIIDPSAAIITPAHQMRCQFKELAAEKRRGSCGMGVGEAVRDHEASRGITLNDVASGRALTCLKNLCEESRGWAEKLMQENVGDPNIHQVMQETYARFVPLLNHEQLMEGYIRFINEHGIHCTSDEEVLRSALHDGESIVFEGAQGALLDRERGFAPHVTQSKTTWHNAAELMRSTKYFELNRRASRYKVTKWGIMRPYAHRHGAGPLVTEDAKFGEYFKDRYNPENPWQGKFRVGMLDLVALKYGIALNDGVDMLAITNLDQLSGLKTIPVCISYDYSRNSRGKLENGWGIHRVQELRVPKDDGWYCGDALWDAVGNQQMCGDSKPGEVIELPGWNKDISHVKKVADLPKEARKFIEFIEGDSGLQRPVGIVSVNPTADGKIMMRDI